MTAFHQKGNGPPGPPLVVAAFVLTVLPVIEITTSSPAFKPESISMLEPLSMPVTTGAG
jgi:hypothetical protein